MSNKVYWNYDPSASITSFTVKRSADMGLTFVLLSTIVFDTNGANFDKQSKRFFYFDGTGAAGNIYAIGSTGTLGTSPDSYVIAPPADPSLCTVIGYARDAFGYADPELSIHVQAFGTPGERWVQNPAGIVSQHGQALGVIGRKVIINPDANGIWQIGLIRKIYARVEIPALDFSWAFEVPDKPGPINIRDIPQLRGQALSLFSDTAGNRLVMPES